MYFHIDILFVYISNTLCGKLIVILIKWQYVECHGEHLTRCQICYYLLYTCNKHGVTASGTQYYFTNLVNFDAFPVFKYSRNFINPLTEEFPIDIKLQVRQSENDTPCIMPNILGSFAI